MRLDDEAGPMAGFTNSSNLIDTAEWIQAFPVDVLVAVTLPTLILSEGQAAAHDGQALRRMGPVGPDLPRP